MDIHEIARHVVTTTGADFAFILNQAGVLVTSDAPRDMPEPGRMAIVGACPKGKSGKIVHLEMSRQELVPYGGAAPIDVFAMRVEDAAVLVAVLATWADKGKVPVALNEGAERLSRIIVSAKKAREKKRALKKGTSSQGRGASGRTPVGITVPFVPTKRDRASASPKPPNQSAPAKKSARASRVSEPDIVVGEAAVGRETLAAIEASLPDTKEGLAIQNTLRALRGSEPDIELGEADVGRETLFAIQSSAPPVKAGPSPQGVRVELASISRESLLEVERLEAEQRKKGPSIEEPLVAERGTLPWVDTPSALKRAADAKARARGAAPAEVSLDVEEMGADSLIDAIKTEQ